MPGSPATPLAGRIAGVFMSKLARASAWLFFGSVAAGVLGYVFQIVMGRLMSPVEYGLFSALMALFTVLSTPLATLTMVLARRVSEYRARGESGAIAHLYRWINGRVGAAGAVVVLAFVLFAPQIQVYVRAPSAMPVMLLGAMLFFTFPPIVNNAFLQGMQSFTWISAIGTLNAFLKIVFSALLVWLGLGLAGALGGGILTAAVMWIVTFVAVRPELARGRGQAHEAPHLSLRQALPVFAANAAFAAMTQLDIVVVNYYFPAHEAGLYAAASILGKAVLYLPGGIAMALFPMVAERHARAEGSAHLLVQAMALTGLLCGSGALAYLLFGEWIMALLYGETYREAGHLLKYFGFAILPMAFILVAEHFLIAKGRVLFAWLFVVTAPLQLVAIHLWHGSPQTVMVIVGLSGLALATAGYALLWAAFARSRAATPA